MNKFLSYIIFGILYKNLRKIKKQIRRKLFENLFVTIKLKSLVLKLTKRHFIKFEISPTMHLALNSKQRCDIFFRKELPKSIYQRLHFLR